MFIGDCEEDLSVRCPRRRTFMHHPQSSGYLNEYTYCVPSLTTFFHVTSTRPGLSSSDTLFHYRNPGATSLGRITFRADLSLMHQVRY